MLYAFVTLRSLQVVGETPVAAAKVRERYSRVEKPESAAISFIGRDVVSRSRFASEIRASAICFCTDDDRHSLNARSTSVREKPTWRNTSEADIPFDTFSRMNASASANHDGACREGSRSRSGFAA